MKKSAILLLFFLGGIILAAGCTGTVPADTAPQVTPPAMVTGTETTSFTPVPADTFWPQASRAGEFTTVPATRPAADNPHLDLLNIRKRTFTDPLPDCIMEQAFPAVPWTAGMVSGRLSRNSPQFLRKITRRFSGNTPKGILRTQSL